MFAGTLQMNLDTTTHDVYALLMIQQKVYGSWSLPKESTQAMRLLEDMRYDRVLWNILSYDPDKNRTRNDYCTIVDVDRAGDDDFMGTLSTAISYVLWDAYCSYKERAIRIIKDYANLSPEKTEQVIRFMDLSERFHNYYTTLQKRIEFDRRRDLESLIKEGTGMFYWELREQIEEKNRKLEAALRFTEHS